MFAGLRCIRTVVRTVVCQLFHRVVVVSGDIQPMLSGNRRLRSPQLSVPLPLLLHALGKETRLVPHHHVTGHKDSMRTELGQHCCNKTLQTSSIFRMTVSRVQITDLDECDTVTYTKRGREEPTVGTQEQKQP